MHDAGLVVELNTAARHDALRTHGAVSQDGDSLAFEVPEPADCRHRRPGIGQARINKEGVFGIDKLTRGHALNVALA